MPSARCPAFSATAPPHAEVGALQSATGLAEHAHKLRGEADRFLANIRAA
jgi:hypothetical protein